MELPEVRNVDSPRDLLRDLGEVYTDSAKLGRDVVYSHILREGVLKNEDTVHWREDFAHYCYNLRHRGFYDDTNSVEDSVEQLEEEVGEGECDRLMKFLTLLAGSVSHITPRSGLIPTGKQVEVLPHHVLPAAQNRYHGDSCAPGVHSSGYLMYRDELFTSVSSCPDINQSEKILAGFPESSTVSRFIRPPNNKLPPPKITLTGLPVPEPTYQLLPLPAPPSRSHSVEEYSSNPVLADLPALPPPTVTGIFKSLSLKSDDLPVYLGPVLRTTVKERYQPTQRNITQRFAPVRPSNSAVSDSSGVESDDDHEAWEEAYKDMDKEFPTPTYELMGRKVLQERPYLTESGSQVYTRLCVLLCSPYSDLDVVTEQHVLYQCQYVLIGIPTSIFQFDKTKVEFVPLQNICYTGVSPDSLVDCLYSIAYSGTLYLRLKMFCDQYSTVERYGNVVKGLVSAVEQYLNLYQAFLSQIPISSLIQLIWKTKDLTSQLEFLCNLLLLEEGLPTGTALIEYLYHTAEILTASPYYKIMLALIRAAFAPMSK
ncbi:uncharacterized protein LOC134820210 [Bolinopsis microptera]|uniref:uncharacterized protein LOC134820210 n=1 Tax=Bolinopsis microptera TaxID=2820187 RepID=UPI00307ADCCD